MGGPPRAGECRKAKRVQTASKVESFRDFSEGANRRKHPVCPQVRKRFRALGIAPSSFGNNLDPTPAHRKGRDERGTAPLRHCLATILTRLPLIAKDAKNGAQLRSVIVWPQS
jgi:hypothetical protein